MKYESLSLAAIDSTKEIQDWLNQFPEDKRIVAKNMLLRLQFISRDVYSAWFQETIGKLLSTKYKYALYAVRKLEEDIFWNPIDEVVSRPGDSLGSEDLVYSLVSNVVRANPKELFDHPTLNKLRDEKIHHFILIDDSIGSGERVYGFINAMLKHKTFLSWWSLGYVKFHIISFSRMRESERNIIKNILFSLKNKEETTINQTTDKKKKMELHEKYKNEKMRQSDHGKRKFRKSLKFKFTSKIVFMAQQIESRWGENFNEITTLCESQKNILPWARKGYGGVMANMIFYHSVPNNIPGIFWFQNEKWSGLFKNRSLPIWVSNLLENKKNVNSNKNKTSFEMMQLLSLVKKGIRSESTIAMRLGCDTEFALALLAQAKNLMLLTDKYRLTMAGHDQIKKAESVQAEPKWDKSLYIPQSWCAGRSTIQPL